MNLIRFWIIMMCVGTHHTPATRTFGNISILHSGYLFDTIAHNWFCIFLFFCPPALCQSHEPSDLKHVYEMFAKCLLCEMKGSLSVSQDSKAKQEKHTHTLGVERVKSKEFISSRRVFSSFCATFKKGHDIDAIK